MPSAVDSWSEEPEMVDLSFLSGTPKLEGIFFGNHKLWNASHMKHLKSLKMLMFTGTNFGVEVDEFVDMFRCLPITMQQVCMQSSFFSKTTADGEHVSKICLWNHSFSHL